MTVLPCQISSWSSDISFDSPINLGITKLVFWIYSKRATTALHQTSGKLGFIRQLLGLMIFFYWQLGNIFKMEKCEFRFGIFDQYGIYPTIKPLVSGLDANP